MELSHAVHGESGDDAQVRHPDAAVLDDGHPADLFGIIGIPVPEIKDKTAVDLFDDLEDPRQKAAEKVLGPDFHRLDHHRVVSVR